MTQSGQSEVKPFFHRWSVVVPAAGIVVAACVALVVGTRSSENESPNPATSRSAQVESGSERPYVASSTTGGWGPERTTYTREHPSPYAQLNSITDKTIWGDQRQFVLCRRAGDSGATASSAVAVSGAAEVEVTVMVENASTTPGQDIHNAKARLLLPDSVADDPAIGIMLSGEGSSVPEVWAGCRLLTQHQSVVSLKPGSVQVTTGSRGAEEVRGVSDGVLIGGDLMPATEGHPLGVIPASSHAYGYIDFTLMVQPVQLDGS